MKKSAILLIALTLTASLGLAACGSNQQASQQAQPAAQEQAQPAQTSGSSETAAPADIKSGVSKMLETTAELKTLIESGDQAKLKEAGPKLEDSWKVFEDKVKEKYPDLYEKVEDALDPTIAGTQANPIDKEALAKLNDQLTQALTDLAGKEK